MLATLAERGVVAIQGEPVGDAGNQEAAGGTDLGIHGRGHFG